MTPLDYYQQQCDNGAITPDQNQLMALNHLQKVYFNLLSEQKKRDRYPAWLRKPKLVPGLYVWGGVGIGKTFLMDCFYHTLPFPKKMRIHFHQFMQMVHLELKQYQGQKNPLQQIAKKFSEKFSVLCFDELYVSDITDAMLLRHLFKALFAQGVCFVATSNAAPDDLYKKGLQRQLFLPAIDLLKQNTEVIHISTLIDYRLRHLKQAGVFYTPNDDKANEKMEKTFSVLTHHAALHYAPIEIYGRNIHIKKKSADIIWFDFNDLCSPPRSQQDYLALAKIYHTIFLSNIPVISPHAKDTIALFIRLIDVLYDAKIRLVFSAAQSIDDIYTEGYLLTDYMRTRSRLLEMQSESYFSHFNTIE